MKEEQADVYSLTLHKTLIVTVKHERRTQAKKQVISNIIVKVNNKAWIIRYILDDEHNVINFIIESHTSINEMTNWPRHAVYAIYADKF